MSLPSPKVRPRWFQEALRIRSCKVGHGVRPSGGHQVYVSHYVSNCLHHRSLEGLKEEQEKKKGLVKEEQKKQVKEGQGKKVKVDEQETKGEEEKVKEGRAGQRN